MSNGEDIVKEDATTTDEKRYDRAYRETRRSLDEAIELLTLLRLREKDADVRSDIGEELLEIKRQRADLVRANISFHSGRATMIPPSPELVSEIVAIAKEVVELTVERATASAVLRLSTKALNKFREIQDIGES